MELLLGEGGISERGKMFALENLKLSTSSNYKKQQSHSIIDDVSE